MNVMVKRKSNYLVHGYGDERKDHKYIRREKGKNGKWIYYYPDEETDNLLDSTLTVTFSNGDKAVVNKKGKITQNLEDAKIFIDRLLKTEKKPIDTDSLKNGENFVKNLFTKVESVLDKKTFETVSDLPVKTTKDVSIEDDISKVNPDYSPDKWSTSNNCAECSLTYDLRRRGYDVEANERKSNDVVTRDIMSDWYDGAELITSSDVVKKATKGEKESVYDYELSEYLGSELTSYGDGARGIFVLQTIGRHAISWEIVNGEPMFIDSQRNVTMTIEEVIKYSSNFEYFRTDNLEVTDEAVKRVRKARG